MAVAVNMTLVLYQSRLINQSFLKIGLLDFRIEEFFVYDRPRNIIIDTWSPEGKAEMGALSKFLSAPISESVKNLEPTEDIFTLKATAHELRNARSAQLRRFARVQPSVFCDNGAV
jgi:hypothetical protein